MQKLSTSLVTLCLAASLTSVAPAVHAGGEVSIFHRYANEGARNSRMAMWQECATELDITIVENFVPSKQYEVQLPVQLSSTTPPTSTRCGPVAARSFRPPMARF